LPSNRYSQLEFADCRLPANSGGAPQVTTISAVDVRGSVHLAPSHSEREGLTLVCVALRGQLPRQFFRLAQVNPGTRRTT
jgi:hypothetical protein